MLLVEHRAFHLFREDAFREYCISVDGYGSWQPASFVYLCFEAFKELCAEYGLCLVYPRDAAWDPDTGKQPWSLRGAISTTTVFGAIAAESERFPWRFQREQIPEPWRPLGLVLRVRNQWDSRLVRERLMRGANVLALIPSHFLCLYRPSDSLERKKCQEAFASLGVAVTDGDVRVIGGPKVDVMWQEITTETPGRLFVTNDCFLSDGYFVPGYGYSPRNEDQIRGLVRQFATFKSPVLRIAPRQLPTTWPTGEPLSLVLDVWNHGPPLTKAILALEVAPEVEPLSPLDRELPSLGPLQRTSLCVQLCPRVDGRVPLFIGATCSSSGCDFRVEMVPAFVEVLPGQALSQRSRALQDDRGLHRLLNSLRKAGLTERGIHALPSLAAIDPPACATRIRVVTERLALRVLDRLSLKPQARNLASAIELLRSTGVVGNRSISYLHTIRIIGNIAAHAAGEPVTEADVRIMAYALASVTDELLDRGLL